MIYIASDHRGFKLKTEIIAHLTEHGVEIKDMGPYEYVEGDDYPDYVIPLAREVNKNPRNNKGIVICGNGVGVSITANRLKGIRAALSWTIEQAKASRLDDDTNVLALPANYIDENTALNIVDAWLNTEFSALPRHIRRIKKLESI